MLSYVLRWTTYFLYVIDNNVRSDIIAHVGVPANSTDTTHISNYLWCRKIARI